MGLVGDNTNKDGFDVRIIVYGKSYRYNLGHLGLVGDNTNKGGKGGNRVVFKRGAMPNRFGMSPFQGLVF